MRTDADLEPGRQPSPLQARRTRMRVVGAAVALTLAALFARDHLPRRHLALTPQAGVGRFFLLGADSASAASSPVRWLDQDPDHFHFACDPPAAASQAPCSFVHLLGDSGGTRGIDLRPFRWLELDLDYRGTAKSVRIGIRDFDSRFSRIEDGNSAKFNNVNVRASELGRPVRIELDEFSVPEWWSSSYDLPRAWIQPDLGNATALSIDFIGNTPGAPEEATIRRIEFSGDLVSPENWYLGIICAWLLLATGFGIDHLLQLRRIDRQHRQRIRDLASRNQLLRDETDHFRKLSTVDALTNTFNRFGIEQILESLDGQMETTALVLIDVDHFKAVNDRRGHDAGDRVLQKVADLLVRGTRASGRIGRWGGEEFLLICPATSPRGAAELANRLRQRIEETVFEPEAPLAITASFGVACVRPGESFADALKRADAALYRAKSRGRNAVVLAGALEGGDDDGDRADGIHEDAVHSTS